MLYEFDIDPGKRLVFRNDNNLSFKAFMVQFTSMVEFYDCEIIGFDNLANYFTSGLYVKNCLFRCNINWQSGGHNLKPIVFENCEFDEFFDFEDCCFDADFVLKNVTFKKGTNLLGNINTPVEVIFATEPQCENVKGNLRINTFQI